MPLFKRELKAPQRSFFLFGPRATGKSTWLKKKFPKCLHLDLLRNDLYFSLTSSPGLFREMILAVNPDDTWIIVDEIQRLPILLNDVHSLIENEGYNFALSGSSARKLKKGQANLLAGRALVKYMFPLIAQEFGNAVTLEEILSFGTLPNVITDKNNRIEQLEAYVGTYLREEIKAEALTRNVPAFSRFLDVAVITNGQVTNLANIARDTGISRSTVSSYFEILTDTLLGSWLPAWTPKAKIKEVSHPKFYFFDCGVIRALQKLLREKPSNNEIGFLFESYILHELKAFISYHNIGGELFYWRTADNAEIDIIWQRGKKIVAFEVKSVSKWKDDFASGFKSLLSSKIKITSCYGIYCGDDVLQKNSYLVLPWKIFLKKLNMGVIL